MRGKNTKKGVQRLTTGEAPVPRESKRRGVHRDWGKLTLHAFAVVSLQKSQAYYSAQQGHHLENCHIAHENDDNDGGGDGNGDNDVHDDDDLPDDDSDDNNDAFQVGGGLLLLVIVVSLGLDDDDDNGDDDDDDNDDDIDVNSFQVGGGLLLLVIVVSLGLVSRYRRKFLEGKASNVMTLKMFIKSES